MAIVSAVTMMKAMDWAYQKAVDGVAGEVSAGVLADDYLRRASGPEAAVDTMIRWQCAKCGASGFVTGLGGILSLPIAMPADLAVNLYVQLRMIAAIAQIGGYDPRSDQVKTLCYLALVGDSGAQAVKAVGVKAASLFARGAVDKVPRTLLFAINQAVGFRLVTKASEKSVVSLTRLVPLVGGVVGGSFDATTTYVIGLHAKKLFLPPGGAAEVVAQA